MPYKITMSTRWTITRFNEAGEEVVWECTGCPAQEVYDECARRNGEELDAGPEVEEIRQPFAFCESVMPSTTDMRVPFTCMRQAKHDGLHLCGDCRWA